MERLYYIEREIKPLRDVLFLLTYQDLAHFDVQRERIEEQIRNYQRLCSTGIFYDVRIIIFFVV